MRRHPFGVAALAGLALVAVLAMLVVDRSYVRRETPAAPETLHQIARKNDAAATRAAANMESRAEARLDAADRLREARERDRRTAAANGLTLAEER